MNHPVAIAALVGGGFAAAALPSGHTTATVKGGTTENVQSARLSLTARRTGGTTARASLRLRITALRPTTLSLGLAGCLTSKQSWDRDGYTASDGTDGAAKVVSIKAGRRAASFAATVRFSYYRYPTGAEPLLAARAPTCALASVVDLEPYAYDAKRKQLTPIPAPAETSLFPVVVVRIR
jgi:hypothetical protein